MNLKKYLVIDHKDVYDDSHEMLTHSFKFKVVQGFLRSEAKEALNIQKNWEALGNDQDKLFFFPGCNVPRFKVRENYACTIKPENATAAFISSSDLIGSDSTFTHYKNLYPIRTDMIKSFVENFYDQTAKKMFLAISANFDKVYLTQELWQNHTWSQKFSKEDEELRHYMDASRYHFKDEMTYSQYQLLGFNRKNNLDQITCDIFLEEDLLAVLNKDNFIIDKEKYQELRSFGKTEDKENQILMMELMSNCDFQKSLVYLLFLIKEFGKDIQNYKEAQHVNFKSLLSFLSIKQVNMHSVDLSTMTRTLREHKKFTRDNAAMLSSLFAGEYIDYSNVDNVCWQEGPVIKPDFETLLITKNA